MAELNNQDVFGGQDFLEKILEELDSVFPQKLPELCIKASTKEGDVVLDPFMGSGTTAYVAQKLSRKWIGIELNPEYVKIIKERTAQQSLF